MKGKGKGKKNGKERKGTLDRKEINYKLIQFLIQDWQKISMKSMPENVSIFKGIQGKVLTSSYEHRL